MKRRKTFYIGLAMLAVGTWATASFGQGQADQGRLAGYVENRDNILNPILRPTDRLLARAFVNIDQLPEDLQAEVLALQESIEAIKDAWENEYKPGEDATMKEIRDARDAFQADYADEIAATKELRLEVVRELRVGMRDRFEDLELDEAAQEILAEYREIKQSLAEAWQVIRDELGDDATREDIAAAKEQFYEDNAELIAQQKELASQLREMIREQREEHEEQYARDDLPPELKQLRTEIDGLRQQIRDRKRQAREDMKGMTRQEREEYRQALIDELKDVHDDIKERRRQAIRDHQDDQDGDRRPED